MQNSTLYLFRFSHYCEKAAWACDLSSLEIEKKYMYPGLHAGSIRKLSDQTSVPVLQASGTVITGSADIIEWLEQNDAKLNLYPSDPELSKEALAVQSRFDSLGAALRGALFTVLLEEPAAAAQLFTGGSKTAAVLYPIFMGMAGGMLKKRITENRSEIEQGVAEAHRALADLSDRLSGRKYLVGDAFSVADLCAASMLFPLCFPDQAGHTIPEKLRPAMQLWFDQWSSYAVIDWVKRIYREHRLPA